MPRANKKLGPLKRGGKGDKALASSMSFSMLDQLQDQLQDYEQTLTSNSPAGAGAMSFGLSGGSSVGPSEPASASDLLDSTLDFMDVQPQVSNLSAH